MTHSKKQTSGKDALHQMRSDVMESYDSEFRFLSYWKQIELVLKLRLKRILYVGVGTGFVSQYLRNRGFEVITVDSDALLKPDIVADIRSISTIGRHFDMAMVCEVLEHIPLAQVETAMRELAKTADKVIISVPENRSKIWIAFKIPMVSEQKWVIPLPFFSKQVTSEVHFWELNPVTQKALEEIFEKTGWRIRQTERVAKSSIHFFYLLEQKK